MDFEVRDAEQYDAPELAAFIRRLGLFSRLETEDAAATTARVSDHLRMCLADDSHTVLVATGSSGTVIGYVSVHWLPYLILSGPEGYVSELFVDETCRGHGVGSGLIDAVVAEARRRNCARLMLEAVKTRESYRREFYPKHGWVAREDMASFIYEL